MIDYHMLIEAYLSHFMASLSEVLSRDREVIYSIPVSKVCKRFVPLIAK